MFLLYLNKQTHANKKKKKENKTPMAGCESRVSLGETGCSIAQVESLHHNYHQRG